MATDIKKRFPLHWPDGWPRTPAAKRQYLAGAQNQFWQRVLSRLERELDLLGAESYILSSNLRAALMGRYTPSKNRPSKTRASPVISPSRARNLVMAQDRYVRFTDNVRSLALVLEGLRQAERHGGARSWSAFFAVSRRCQPPRRRRGGWQYWA